jgi:hypothetical protein
VTLTTVGTSALSGARYQCEGVLLRLLLIQSRRITVFSPPDGCRCPVLAAHDLEGALANVPRQDADCEGLIGVNVYGSAARLEFTVAHRTRGA